MGGDRPKTGAKIANGIIHSSIHPAIIGRPASNEDPNHEDPGHAETGHGDAGHAGEVVGMGAWVVIGMVLLSRWHIRCRGPEWRAVSNLEPV